MALKKIYAPKLLVLRIKLEHIRPFVIRKVIVRNTITFHTLHEIIQHAMGWGNYHLYEFKIGDYVIDYEDSGFNFFSRTKRIPSKKTPIARFLNETKDKIKYTYDFGDSWEHVISVSKVMENDPKVKYPKCIKASRACPPEDCGGVGGYYSLIEALQDENPDEEAQEYLEWVGEDYDPENVDIDFINELLSIIKMR